MPQKPLAGRPTLYRPEFADQARKLCLLGATDVEMANFFGVSEKTLNAWKKRHGEFLQSITCGKLLADAEVADRMHQRALGYSHKALKMFQSGGEIISQEYIEHYPPDTSAASLWLRNRQPTKWRDKQDLTLTGKNDGPVQVENIDLLAGVNLDSLNDDELDTIDRAFAILARCRAEGTGEAG